MTNLGLSIQLCVLPFPHGRTVALLDCHYENDFNARLGITLQETSTSSVFRRISPHKMRVTNEEALAAELQTIIIGDQTQYGREDQRRTTPYIIRFDPRVHKLLIFISNPLSANEVPGILSGVY
jgi:hypothetical protein